MLDSRYPIVGNRQSIIDSWQSIVNNRKSINHSCTRALERRSVGRSVDRSVGLSPVTRALPRPAWQRYYETRGLSAALAAGAGLPGCGSERGPSSGSPDTDKTASKKNNAGKEGIEQWRIKTEDSWDSLYLYSFLMLLYCGSGAQDETSTFYKLGSARATYDWYRFLSVTNDQLGQIVIYLSTCQV